MKIKLTLILFALLSLQSLAEKGSKAFSSTLIKNVDIITKDEIPILKSHDLLIRNGKIENIGLNIKTGPGTEVIDGQGQVLTAGIFASETDLALKEIDGVEETNDLSSKQSHFSASLNIADSLNPYSVALPVNRTDGVTTAVVLPGSRASLFAGTGSVISLCAEICSANDLQAFILKPQAALVGYLGEYGASLAGGSRPAAFAKLREAFEEAKSNGLRLPSGLSNESQLSPLDIKILKMVLSGGLPFILNVNRASDIKAAIKLSKDYSFKLIISGAAEAWMVAKDLAKNKISVLLDPTADLPERFESFHTRQDNVQILHKEKVKFAFTGGGSSGPRNLRQSAGIAAAWGLDKKIAFAAITQYPAEIFGLSNSLGTVIKGQKADLVLWSGDPLELSTHAVKVWIQGQAMPNTNRQILLRDKYFNRLKSKMAM